MRGVGGARGVAWHRGFRRRIVVSSWRRVAWRGVAWRGVALAASRR
ncbi:hypothetical protein ACXZ9C_10490 [Streptococcus agalactiae]